MLRLQRVGLKLTKIRKLKTSSETTVNNNLSQELNQTLESQHTSVEKIRLITPDNFYAKIAKPTHPTVKKIYSSQSQPLIEGTSSEKNSRIDIQFNPSTDHPTENLQAHRK